jgi:hypothetical protein
MKNKRPQLKSTTNTQKITKPRVKNPPKPTEFTSNNHLNGPIRLLPAEIDGSRYEPTPEEPS